MIYSDYKEYHTDSTVKFVVKMAPNVLANLERAPGGLHKAFKLQTTLSVNSMVLFDSYGCLRRYESVEQILREFVGVRFDIYVKRKHYMTGLLKAQAQKLSNQVGITID